MSLLVLPWKSIGMNSLVIKTKQQFKKKLQICRQIALLVLVRVHTLAAFGSEYEDDYEYEF